MILLCKLCAKKQMSAQSLVLNVCQQHVHLGCIFHKIMDGWKIENLGLFNSTAVPVVPLMQCPLSKLL